MNAPPPPDLARPAEPPAPAARPAPPAGAARASADDPGRTTSSRGGWLDATLRRRVLDALRRWPVGRVTVVLPDGTRVAGDAPAPGAGPAATLVVRDPAFFRKVALRGRLGLGESYVDGDWTSDDLATLLELGVRNAAVARPPLLARVGAWFLPRRLDNDRAGSRRNVQAHYDLGNDFYALWLDETMTYSSAVVAREDEPLGDAQRRKLEAVARKACVADGDRVLEIGCGWGSFALHAATTRACHVTGLTVSPAQHAFAVERVRRAGLSDRVDLRLQDWRDERGTYDAVVSVEMLEAVGRRWWRPWFEAVDRVLAPDGVAAVQVICHPDRGFDRYAARTDWVERHVFPGTLLGSLGAFGDLLARNTRLRVFHVEDLALSYAWTLRRWRERFLARLPEVAALGFDDRFVRRWTYYLAVCEAAFRARRLSDLQLVLAREGCGRLSTLGTAPA